MKINNGIVYLNTLERFVFPQIAQIERQSGQRVVFMQGGARLVTFMKRVNTLPRKPLNRFQNCWSNRDATNPWPPMSPDHRNKDFYGPDWTFTPILTFSGEIRKEHGYSIMKK